MSFSQGMALILVGYLLVAGAVLLWNRLRRRRFDRRLIPDHLSTRKRKIAERAYRSSYDRRYL